MPRAGSPPPGPPAPMNIGEVANAPFSVLPDPARVFTTRAERLAALAAGHELAPYLRFLSGLATVQRALLEALPAPELPSVDRLRRARLNGMPPLALAGFAGDDVFEHTFAGLLDRLAAIDMPASSRAALEAVRAAGAEARRGLARAVVIDEVPPDAIARHVLAAAAMQVHFTRLAALLDVATLQKVAPGACPACGSHPVASAVVGWEGASNTRFCTCAMCATQWNVARVTCLVCGGDKGVAYHSLEGGSDNVMAETCDGCASYVKILYQLREPALDPVADDVASLALDIKLREQGFARAGANPFLMGY